MCCNSQVKSSPVVQSSGPVHRLLHTHTNTLPYTSLVHAHRGIIMEGIIIVLEQNELLRPEPTLYPILQIVTFIVETCVVPV